MTDLVPSVASAGSAFRTLTGASSRRGFLAAAGISAASLTALAACGSGETAGSGTSSAPSGGDSSVAAGAYGDISVQLSWIKNIEFAGEYFADAKGYYAAAGFTKVDLKTGPVDSADALVAAGTVDIGLSAPDATARYIIDQGAQLKIIGSTFQKNPFCIVSLEEGKPIRTVADLAGKTLGIQAGTNQSISTVSAKPTASTRRPSRPPSCSTTPRSSSRARSTGSWPT